MVGEARIPGVSIAVPRGSCLVYADAFGDADLTTPVAAVTTTRYLWLSMTKLVSRQGNGAAGPTTG